VQDTEDLEMNVARMLMTLAVMVAVGVPRLVGANPQEEAGKILGAWVLSYTTKDANRDRVLDESERRTPDTAAERNSATGFLQFEKGGSVSMDRQLRFKGRYEIVAQDSHDQLVLTFEKDIGTYRMLVIRVSDKELVLEPGIGMLAVYRRP
jgi:hypothetical protein